MSWLALVLFSTSVWAAQDPTAPLGWQQSNKSGAPARLPTLQSIVCGETRQCSVILNGKEVNLGGWVNGYKLTKVNDDSVVLSRSGKQWRLALFTSDIKTY